MTELREPKGPSGLEGWWLNHWTRHLTRYHWWVFILCSLGWTFDTMDQRLFVLARNVAMKELTAKTISDAPMERVLSELADAKIKVDPAKPETEIRGLYSARKISDAGRLATMIFIFGWATGGIFFGSMGDRWGRARTMMITILVYAGFTAFSGWAQNIWQFNLFRFVAGMGVGGEFAAGVALLSEVIPEKARPHALGMMQGLSAVGNITGALIGMLQAQMGWSWRVLFYFGAIPALLVVLIRATLKEPDAWTAAKKREAEGKGKTGSIRDLFAHPTWRRNTLFGVAIAVVGVTGTWGIGFYTPELIDKTLGGVAGKGLDAAALGKLKSKMMLFQDFGAFFAMYGFAVISAWIGRRKTFILACVAGFASVAVVFGSFNQPSHVYAMGFLLGIGTMILFGGYAVYFPELFPTRLRSTGVSFCYNVARYLAGVIQGPIPRAIEGRYLAGGMAAIPAMRASMITLAGIYLIGAVVMIFAPETMGKPLPTEDGEEPSDSAEPAAAGFIH